METEPTKIDPYILDEMAEKIASQAHLSPNIVKKYGEEAILNWEKATGLSISCLMKMSSLDRTAYVNKIIETLRCSLQPLVPSLKTLNKSMCIASVSMELMLNPLY